VAIGAHLVGATGLLLANRDRVRDQKGVGASSVIKAVLTAAAIGTTAYSGMLGAKIAAEGSSEPTEGGTDRPATRRITWPSSSSSSASCSGLRRCLPAAS
jgi:hypothetical protein